MNDRRIVALDGIRGLAIALVLVWHYGQNQLRPEAGSFAEIAKRLLGFTWSGVDLFFVLSGFLIAGILLDKRHSERYFRSFYIRRGCRILPIYYLDVLLFYAVWRFWGIDEPGLDRLFASADLPEWTYATFTQNIWMGLTGAGVMGWLSITWSLAVEEQFYLFLPLVVRFVPYRALPWVFSACVLGAVLLRETSPGLNAYINTPWRADSLLLGALLAWMVRDAVLREVLERSKVWLALVVLGLFSGVVYVTWNGALKLGGSNTHLALAVMYACLVALAVVSRGGWFTGLLRMRPLVWLGTISYGVYLLHVPVSGIVHYALRGQHPAMYTLRDAAVTFTALGITLTLAHLSFHFFEKRIIALGHRFRY